MGWICRDDNTVAVIREIWGQVRPPLPTQASNHSTEEGLSHDSEDITTEKALSTRYFVKDFSTTVAYIETL